MTVLKLLRVTLPAGLQIRCRLPDGSAPVAGSPAEVQHLLVSLCTLARARWSGTAGGTIEVTVERIAAAIDPEDDERGSVVGSRRPAKAAAVRCRRFCPLRSTTLIGARTKAKTSVPGAAPAVRPCAFEINNSPGGSLECLGYQPARKGNKWHTFL